MGWDKIIYHYLLGSSQGKKARNIHQDLNRYGNFNWSLESDFLPYINKMQATNLLPLQFIREILGRVSEEQSQE